MADKSNKKAESSLPTDAWTPTDGMNYGLDGFFHDMDYGAGVEDAARLPASRGLSHLPGDLVTSEGVFDTGNMRSDEEGFGDSLGAFIKESGLSNLDWLDDAIIDGQDPLRLPVNPINIIPELEAAWGNGFVTDGINLIPNSGASRSPADVEASMYPNEKASFKAQAVIDRCHRRSARGHSLKKIFRQAHESMGENGSLLAKSMKEIKANHGLAGNVYLLASAFPGMVNGKWDNYVRKHFASALYIVADDPKMAALDNYLGKRIVSSVSKVPWKQAFAHYGPELERTGQSRGLTGSENPSSKEFRKLLRKSFRTPTKAEEHALTSFVTHQAPSQRVTKQQAHEEFKQAQNQPSSRDEKEAALDIQAMDQAHKELRQMVSSGLLTTKQARKIIGADLSADKKNKLASRLVALRMGTANITPSDQKKVADYEGPAFHQHHEKKRVRKESLNLQDRDRKKEQTRVVSQLVQWTKSGHLTKEQARKIASTVAPANMLKAAMGIIQAPDQRDYEAATFRPNASQTQSWSKIQEREQEFRRVAEEGFRKSVDRMVEKKILTDKQASVILQEKTLDHRHVALRHALSQHESRPYQGKVYEDQVRRHNAYEKAVPVLLSKQQQKVLRYAQQAMSEGSAGQELKDILEVRFSSPLLASVQEPMKSLRTSHEGLAGHLYVDASAYASVKGTEGCDKGALRHRANALNYVLAMDRCKGCVFANADGVCQKYNKILAQEVPHANPEVYQKEAIRLANASDAEVTASLFQGTYDPEEFQLYNNSLDDISYEKNASPDVMGDVQFGGFEF